MWFTCEFLSYIYDKYEKYEWWYIMVLIGEGPHIFGTVTVGERGQIVIPKEARDSCDINAGDKLLVVGNKDNSMGLGIVKADIIKNLAQTILKDIDYNEINHEE